MLVVGAGKEAVGVNENATGSIPIVGWFKLNVPESAPLEKLYVSGRAEMSSPATPSDGPGVKENSAGVVSNSKPSVDPASV